MTLPYQQDDLTAQQSDYALFLPALSGFYATFIGKQRTDNTYVDPARFPPGMTSMEELNWLNDRQGRFHYKWSLYSAGHANLDLTREDAGEDMVRKRDPNTLILGDSGGFQIAKGQWEGDWKANSGCPKAQKKRDGVLKWLDGVANYGMVLDIPAWVALHPREADICGIHSYQEAVDATKFNNEYFIKHRKGVAQGGTRFLNVLQGSNHEEADAWYDTMKVYNDPAIYPDRHFDGWAMGGQTKTDVHLMIRRLIMMRYDNLLQPGKHDWLHVLGTSKLEYAVLLTVLQRAIRKYVNPAFTISFDCASPFLATANGQIYYQARIRDKQNWSYRMIKSLDDKKYAQDNRSFRDAAMQDFPERFPIFEQSPISAMCRVRDICCYKPGVRKTDAELGDVEFDNKNPDHYHVLPDVNKIGKIGNTSWDTFSYALQMGHNVWSHIYAVQEANRQFDAGLCPRMLQWSSGDYAKFKDIVEEIFAAPGRDQALAVADRYYNYWPEILGNHGYIGKKTISARPMFGKLFEELDEPDMLEDQQEAEDRETLADFDPGNL